MARLSSDERTKLLSLLLELPELQEAEGRRQILNTAGLPEVLPLVDLQGRSFVVLSALIEKLESYEPGVLGKFLTAVQQLLGPASDERRFLDHLLADPASAAGGEVAVGKAHGQRARRLVQWGVAIVMIGIAMIVLALFSRDRLASLSTVGISTSSDSEPRPPHSEPRPRHSEPRPRLGEEEENPEELADRRFLARAEPKGASVPAGAGGLELTAINMVDRKGGRLRFPVADIQLRNPGRRLRFSREPL
jgi:hypothetical protein